MKTLRTLMVLSAVMLLTGCRKPTLQLTEDEIRNMKAVAAYIPTGTDKDSAVERMSKAGFTCKVIEGGTLVDVEPKTGAADRIGRSVSLIICDKQPGSSGGISYQVLLYLDDAGHVKRHGLRQGSPEP